MKKTLILVSSIAVMAVLLTGFLNWKAKQHAVLVIETNLLPPPSAKGLHPELGKRIAKLNERSIEGPDAIGSLAQLSQLYHANGYLNRAWQNYRILIELDEDNPLWHYRLATIISSFGQLSDAVALYQKAVKLNPEYTPSHIHLGNTLLKLDRFDEAESVFQNVIDRLPSNPFALFGLARIAIAQNDLPRAQRLLESARHSNKRIGGDLLADVYEALGETSKARSLLREVTWSSHVDIPDPWVDDMITDCYDSFEIAMAGGKAGRLGNTDKAIQLLRKAVALDPLDHNAHNHLADLLVTKGDLKQAREAYESCIGTLPTFDQGWAGLISVEMKSGNHARAAELIDQAIEKCPDSYVINNYKGEALLNENRPQDAVPYFKTTIRVAPQNAVGYNYLARTYLVMRENRKALEQLEKALKAEPRNPLTLELITIFFILAGQEERAQSYLHEALASPRIEERALAQLNEMFRKRFP